MKNPKYRESSQKPSDSDNHLEGRTAMRRRVVLTAIIAVCNIVAIAGAIYASQAEKLTTYQGGPPYTGEIPDELPAISRLPGEIIPNGDALSTLQYDDGSCENGLGLTGGSWSCLVDFDVPTQCIQPGLDVVGLSLKGNSNTAFSFVLIQGGAAPTGTRIALAFTPVVGNGPCPTTQGIQTRSIGPGLAIVSGTQNFFAGVVGNLFCGRDTNSTPAGRIWLRTSGGFTFSPAYLSGLGFGGNWVLRATVEDAGCVPVELKAMTIE